MFNNYKYVYGNSVNNLRLVNTKQL